MGENEKERRGKKIYIFFGKVCDDASMKILRRRGKRGAFCGTRSVLKETTLSLLLRTLLSSLCVPHFVSKKREKISD
jgi:hypothetical protein